MAVKLSEEQVRDFVDRCDSMSAQVKEFVAEWKPLLDVPPDEIEATADQIKRMEEAGERLADALGMASF